MATRVDARGQVRGPRLRSASPLAQLRRERGVFQDELAGLLGVSLARFSYVENAAPERPKSWPTVEQAQWLAAWFAVSVSDFWPFLSVGRCSCDDRRCAELTFNGRRAYGCQNRTPEARARASAQGLRFKVNLRPKTRTGPTLSCTGCGRPVYRSPSHVRARNFHSLRCWARYRLDTLGWRRELRQRLARSNKRRFGSTKLFGHLGGRPLERNDSQASKALDLVAQGLSDKAAGRVVGMTRRQVQYARAKAAQNPS